MEQNKYTLFWLDGKAEIVEGNSISNAMNNRGYGAGAVRALDFYSNGDDRENWTWDKSKRNWEKIIP